MCPGETPPDSAQTSGLSEPQPTARHTFTPTSVVSFVAIAVFVLLFVVTGVAILVTVVL